MRSGVAFLSRALSVPIYPVYSERLQSGAISFKYFPEIEPPADQKDKRFVRDCCQHLYGLLQDFLSVRPEQWTCWPHIHHYFGLIKQTRMRRPRSPYVRHGAVFVKNEKYYLLDRENYVFFRSDVEMYEKWKEKGV